MTRTTRRLALHTLAGAAVLALLPQFALAAEGTPRVALVMKSLANEFFQTPQSVDDFVQFQQRVRRTQKILVTVVGAAFSLACAEYRHHIPDRIAV